MNNISIKNSLILLIIIAACISLIQKCSPSLSASYNAGLQSYNDEKYRTAIAHFTRALWDEPTNPEIYFLRAGCKFYLKDYPGAIDDYSHAIITK